MKSIRALMAIITAGMLSVAATCGGSSSSSSSSNNNASTAPADNTVNVTAGPGPSTVNPYTNGAFVSVTICVPGSASQCTTVPDVLLDTGSSGLRVLSSALDGLPLTNMTSGGATNTSCQLTTVPLTSQIQNPVALFAADNNGIMVTLPALPAAGLPSTSGTLTFGIGTQSDNGVGSAVVQTQNSDGNITTVFDGASYSSSFIDSGSNALYFLNSTTTGLPACKVSVGFYCPSATQYLSATNMGANNRSSPVDFAVANADSLPAPNWIFGDVAGNSSAGGSQSGLPSLYFDWGLPFFFGRTVYVAIEARSTPDGTGPYWAY